MKDCGVELKVSEWQMNAWTTWPCDTVKARRGIAYVHLFVLALDISRGLSSKHTCI